MQCVEPEDYKAEVYPADIKPCNDGDRPLDYYPRKVGWVVAAAILEGKRELYKDIIDRYIRQCETVSQEVVPENCYVW